MATVEIFGCIWVHGLLHGVNARSAMKVVSGAGCSPILGCASGLYLPQA
jgi:hypothetical protein